MTAPRSWIAPHGGLNRLHNAAASNDLPAAKALADERKNVEAVHLDAGDDQAVAKLIQNADVVLR